MTSTRRLFNAAILLLVSLCMSTAETLSCGEVAIIAKMTRADSTSALTSMRGTAGISYQADFIFAVRSFQLHPKSKEASRLLALMPQNENQENALMSLGDSLCDTESLHDMRALSRVRDNVPRMLSAAVIIDRSFLSRYIGYGIRAVRDPHSDFAVRMEVVCREDRAGFDRAVAQLPEPQMQWFTKHVVHPKTCRALTVPEADH